jgi:SpoVK/Ycf46/Vps4 family AAA+-type ATPase
MNNKIISNVIKKKVLYEKYTKITSYLDNNLMSDNSNKQFVKYNKYSIHKKKAIDDFLINLTVKNNKFNQARNIFENNATDIGIDTYSYQYPYFRKASQIPLPIKKSPPIIKKTVNIQVEIDSIGDILKLIKEYPLNYDVEYNINMEAIHAIKEPLMELDNMIGMYTLKNSIVDQILYFIQDFHKVSNSKNDDFMHTVIYGPPGTGKTEIAKIMGKIFSKLGILSKQYFKKVTRADLIAGYLGQTALKTREVVKDAIGGVLFIDEAYALGNTEKQDSFAKECLDTLCEGLSDNKDNLMVIIAGYEEELKKCFFSYNQGLESRFTWRFKTDDYKSNDLFLIFKKKVNDIGWKLNEDIKNNWFENKMDDFKFYGRDIETFLAKVKIAHGRRVFCLPVKEKLNINNKDLEKGYKFFLNNKNEKKEDLSKQIFSQMYC